MHSPRHFSLLNMLFLGITTLANASCPSITSGNYSCVNSVTNRQLSLVLNLVQDEESRDALSLILNNGTPITLACINSSESQSACTADQRGQSADVASTCDDQVGVGLQKDAKVIGTLTDSSIELETSVNNTKISDGSSVVITDTQFGVFKMSATQLQITDNIKRESGSPISAILNCTLKN